MDQEEINKKIVGKIIKHYLPNLDSIQLNTYLSYCTRLLNSRITMTTTQEATIMNLILEKSIYTI